MDVKEVEDKILEILKTKNIVSKRELMSTIEDKNSLNQAIQNLLSKEIIFEINILGGNYYGLKRNRNSESKDK